MTSTSPSRMFDAIRTRERSRELPRPQPFQRTLVGFGLPGLGLTVIHWLSFSSAERCRWRCSPKRYFPCCRIHPSPSRRLCLSWTAVSCRCCHGSARRPGSGSGPPQPSASRRWLRRSGPRKAVQRPQRQVSAHFRLCGDARRDECPLDSGLVRGALGTAAATLAF
jgi:hypothetical protein